MVVSLLIVFSSLGNTFAESAKALADRIAMEKSVARQLALEEIRSQWNVAKSLSNDGVDEAALKALEKLQATIRFSPEPKAVETYRQNVVVELVKVRKRLDAEAERIASLQERQSASVIAAQRERARKVEGERVRGLLRKAQTAYDTGNYKAASSYSDQILALNPSSRQAGSMKRMALRESYGERIARIQSSRDTGRQDVMLAAEEAMVIPKPGQVMVYPSADKWRRLSERRKKYRQSKVKPPEPWQLDMQKRLQQPLSFEFENTPLVDVLEFMQETTKVNIILDRSAIGDANEPITLSVNQMSTKSALDWVVRMVDLEYALMHEAVFVSSRSRLEKFRPKETHMYDLEEMLNMPGGLRAAGMAKREAAEDWVTFLKKILETKPEKDPSMLK